MQLPITTSSAIILAVLLLVLSAQIIIARRKYGDSNDELVTRRVRGQGNLIEYAPTAMILILLAEIQGSNTFWLFLVSTIFLVGRILHGFAFGFTEHWKFGRFYGTILTWAGLALLALSNLLILLFG